MSFSISKGKNKKKFYPKINNLKKTPFYTNHTTANSSQINTLIMNSHQENFYKNEKTQYSSRNQSKNGNNNLSQKNKNMDRKKGNLPLKKIINNNFIKSKESSYNKDKKSLSKIKSNKKHINKINMTIKNRRNANSTKNNKRDKNINNSLNQSSDIDNKKKTNILKLSNISKSKRLSNQHRKKLECDRKVVEGVKKESKNILRIKQNNIKEKRSYNSVNKKIFSRNKDLKIQYSSFKNISDKYTSNSTKNNNIKNNYNKSSTNRSSNSNRKNKNKINKTVYYKKKLKDSFILINNKKSNREQNNLGNYSGNYNYLVNLILKNKKNINNNKACLTLKKKENNVINVVNKNSSSKFTKKANININHLSNQKSPLNNNTEFGETNKRNNIKRIFINKEFFDRNFNNRILKKCKSTDNKKINNKKTNEKKIIKNIKLRHNIKRINNFEKNNNSIISLGKKDNFFDMTETNSKLNNIKEKTDKGIKINNIKINEFSVKKPKEENMKFTLFKNRNEEEETEEINKSRVIIGTIEAYKDILDDDKSNSIFFQKDNSTNFLNSNSLDNNNSTLKKNKNILLNFNSIDEKNYKEKNKKNNNIEGLEIDNNINGFLLNNSEIKSLLNYVEDDFEEDNFINDLSTTILNGNIKYKNNLLLPYHVNIISYMKKYNAKTKSYLLQGNFNSDNIQLAEDNKLSNIKICNKKNNSINEIGQKDFKKEKNIKYKTKYRKNITSKVNNVIQNICNFSYNEKEKKCIIF